MIVARKNSRKRFWLLLLATMAVYGCGGGGGGLTLPGSDKFSGGERIDWAERKKLDTYECKNKPNEKRTMSDLITELESIINVKRVLLTPGGCYLALGRYEGRNFASLYDPVSFQQIAYSLMSPQSQGQ